MKDEERINRIECRHRKLNRSAILFTVIGNTETVKKNRILSSMFLFGGGALSIASFISYIQSLEKYGLTEDVDETKIILNYLLNVVAVPTTDILLFSSGLRDIVKRR